MSVICRIVRQPFLMRNWGHYMQISSLCHQTSKQSFYLTAHGELLVFSSLNHFHCVIEWLWWIYTKLRVFHFHSHTFIYLWQHQHCQPHIDLKCLWIEEYPPMKTWDLIAYLTYLDKKTGVRFSLLALKQKGLLGWRCVCVTNNTIFGKEQDRITNFTLNSDIVASLTQWGNTSCYTVAVLVLSFNVICNPTIIKKQKRPPSKVFVYAVPLLLQPHAPSFNMWRDPSAQQDWGEFHDKWANNIWWLCY